MRFLSLFFLVVSFLPVALAETGGDRLRVGPLEIQTSDDRVIISTAPSTDLDATLETIDNPPRAVIDLPNVSIPNEPRLQFSNHPVFTTIRMGRHETFTRIVLDLKELPSLPLRLLKKPHEITIQLTDKVLPTAAIPSAPSKAAAIAPKVPVVRAAEIVPPPEINVELKFTVNTLEVQFPMGGRPIQDIIVKNRSDKPLFMTSSAEAVLHAGLPDESRTATTDLLVSPRRFELKRNEERGIRVILSKRNDVNEEKVFRVNLVPDAEPFDVQLRKHLSVTTGLSMLVTAEPRDPQPILNWEWKKDSITIQNKGNSNVLLDRGQACGDGVCSPLPTRRLYPGTEWELAVGQATTLEFLQKIGSEFNRLEIKRD